jgi:hypothetical protein
MECVSLVKIWCEYDFGGNIDGYTGVYTTSEIAIQKVNSSLEEDDFETLQEQGLADWEWIEIE